MINYKKVYISKNTRKSPDPATEKEKIIVHTLNRIHTTVKENVP